MDLSTSDEVGFEGLDKGLHDMVTDDKLNVAMRASTVRAHMRKVNSDSHDKHPEHFMTEFILEHEKFIADHKENYHIYPTLILNLLTGSNPVPKTAVNGWINTTYEVLARVAKYECKPLLQQFEGLDECTAEFKLQQLLSMRDPDLDNLILAYHYTKGAVDRCNNMNRFKWDKNDPWKSLKSRRFEIKPLKVEGYMGVNVMWLCFERTWYLLPNTYLLLIFNKLCDLTSVMSYSLYMSKCTYSPRDHANNKLYIKELFLLAERYQDQYFLIGKALEPLVQAEIIGIVDEDKVAETHPDVEYILNIMNELARECYFYYHTSKLRSYITRAVIPLMNEYGCLSKICGHPFVTSETGVQKIHAKSNEIRELDLLAIHRTGLMAKKNFISNYITAYKKWPDVDMSLVTNKYLINAEKRNVDPNSQTLGVHGIIALDDYEPIIIKPMKEFNMFPEVVNLIKDKTITRLRERVEGDYLFKDWTVLDNPEEARKARMDYYRETRLLLHYLCKELDDTTHLKYLEKYKQACADKNWDLISDYNVIRLVPKEKELKTDPRVFGCQTYQNRIRCLLQEYNCAEFLEEFHCEQAMTQNGLQMAIKLHQFRNIGKAYKGYQAIYINIDASAWCNRFRNLPVAEVAKILDQYYNTNIYGSTMEYYQNTLFYMMDPDGVFYWKGQNGGIEGLNQYTWLYVYINQIHTALEGIGYPYHMLCKGDDLRLAIMIKQEDLINKNLGEVKKGLLNRIITFCKNVGHEIKMADSYASYHYFAFSKAASIFNSELPQAFRKIQKLYGANNAALNVKSDYISATFSNAHSACAATTNPIPCYLTGLLWCLIYLTRDALYRNLTINELHALVLTPSVVGGLPIIYLDNMLVRAESDLLPPFIMRIQYYEKHLPQVAKVMKRFLNISMPRGFPSDNFCYDAYAIPLPTRPTLALTYLRNHLKRKIRMIAVNKTIVELLDNNSNREFELFKQVLRSANVYYPRVIAHMYSLSVWSIFDSFVRKFDSSGSIIKALCNGLGFSASARRYLRGARKLDNELHRWIVNTAQDKRERTQFCWEFWSADKTCPGEIAQFIRETLYQKKIYGITMCPLRHQLSIYKGPPQQVSNYTLENHFVLYYKESNDLPEPLRKLPWDYQVGPFEPQYGSVTSSGNIRPQHKIDEFSKATNNATGCLTMGNWLDYDGSNAPELCLALFKQYTSAKPENLDKCHATKKSGTLTHHQVGGGFETRIAFNALANNTTKFQGISSTHLVLYRNNPKMHMNFMHIYLHAVAVMCLNKQVNPDLKIPKTLWVETKECTFCNRPVVEPALMFNESLLTIFSKTVRTLTTYRAIVNGDKLIQMYVANIPRTLRDDTRGTLELDEAVEGILCAYFKEIISSMERVTDRYGTQSLTSSGPTRLLSLTSTRQSSITVSRSELKKMRPMDILAALNKYVMEYYDLRFIGQGREAIEAHLSMKIGESLPWYMLLKDIEQCFITNAFLRAFTQKTRVDIKNPNHTAEVAKVIGKVLMTDYFPERRVVTKIVRLSYWESDQPMRILISKLRKYCYNCLQSAMTLTLSDEEQRASSLWDMYTNYHETEDVTFNLFRVRVHSFMLYYLLEWIMERCCLEDDGSGKIVIYDGTRINFDGDFILRVSYDVSQYMIGKNVGDEVVIGNYRFGTERINQFRMVDQAINMIDDFIEVIGIGSIDIQVVYTTYARCVECIRGNTIQEIENQEIEPYEADPTLTMSANLDFGKEMNKTYRVLTKRLYTIRSNDVTVFDSTIQEHVDDIDVQRLIYPDRVYWKRASAYKRIYGQSTSTPSYLVEVLEYFKLRKRDYHGLNIAALADGFGGLTDIFSRIVNNSTFLFTTMQEYDRGLTEPLAEIVDLARSKHNYIDTYLITLGLSDLTEESVIQAVIDDQREGREKRRSFNIIYCDATFPNDTSLDYMLNLYSNILRVYKASGEGCFLYMRTNILALLTSRGRKYLALLRYYCENLHLFKPRSSDYEFEVYIVATRNASEDMPANVYTLNDMTSKNIGSFYDCWARLQNSELANEVRVITRPSTYIELKFIDLPPAYVGRLQRENVQVVPGIRGDVMLAMINRLITVQYGVILDLFQHHKDQTIKTKIVSVGTYLFYEGFLMGFINDTLVETTLMDEYKTLMTKFVRDAQFNLPLRKMYTDEEGFPYCPFRGYKRYLDGVLCGFRAKSYDLVRPVTTPKQQ